MRYRRKLLESYKRALHAHSTIPSRVAKLQVIVDRMLQPPMPGLGRHMAHRRTTGRDALFYVRLFAGLVAVEADQLIDLDCVSHEEQGYCAGAWCSYNLADYQKMLHRRRNVTKSVSMSTGCCWKESIFSCLAPIKRAGFHRSKSAHIRDHLDYHDVGLVQCAARLI